MSSHSTLILDTETTGKTESQAVEVAWISLDDPATLAIQEQFQQRYQPDIPISLGAMATHHILPSDLVGCPHPSTFSLPAKTQYLIGHNVDFDWTVLGQPDVRRICTLAMSRTIWPDFDSHSLSALMYGLSKNPERAREALRSAHSAMADVKFTHFLLRQILVQHPVATWEELWVFSENCRVPKVMPFGKHRGVPIADLDPDYIRWATRNLADLDPYLRQAFQRRLSKAGG